MASEETSQPKTVVWEGDSLEVLREFPAVIRRRLGQDIHRLQLGAMPLNSRPMKSIGQGVFELRQFDKQGWYRVIYLKKVEDRLFVLHSLVKKVAKTPRKDLDIASRRLKAVQSRLAEEKRDEKRSS